MIYIEIIRSCSTKKIKHITKNRKSKASTQKIRNTKRQREIQHDKKIKRREI
jgi:hypothetical protein